MNTIGHTLTTELQPVVQNMYHHLADIGLVITDGNACFPYWTAADTAVFTACYPDIMNIDRDTKYETIYNALARARTAITATRLAVKHEPEKLNDDQIKAINESLVATGICINQIIAIIEAAIA